MMERTTLDRLDFSPYAGPGLRVFLHRWPGLRCPACGASTLEGSGIEAALVALTAAIVEQDRVLLSAEAAFLRKRLGLSQAALAKRSNYNRVTIADWERGGPLTPAASYTLRGLTIAALVQRPETRDLAARLMSAHLGRVAHAEALGDPVIELTPPAEAA